MLGIWQKGIDIHQTFVALLTDLSKAVGRLNHDLLIINLQSYDISYFSLRLLADYFVIVLGRKLNMVSLKDLR